MNSRPQTAAHTASLSLARLSAAQLLDGYRTRKFTPRDVVDEVIAAPEATDSLCNVIATDMFASARIEADRATAAWKAGEAKALTGVPITVKDLVYVAGTPAKGGAPMLGGWSPFSWPINLAGLPAATVPCGWDREGLPIGLQIVAPWLSENTIFSVAAVFEHARPWADAWPQFTTD